MNLKKGDKVRMKKYEDNFYQSETNFESYFTWDDSLENFKQYIDNQISFESGNAIGEITSITDAMHTCGVCSDATVKVKFKSLLTGKELVGYYEHKDLELA